MRANSSQDAAQIFSQARKTDPANCRCFECNNPNPQWASASLGIFLCLECSGLHRGLGVHLSFVRSLTMDKWKESELSKMKIGGNSRLKQYLQDHNLHADTDLQTRYSSNALQEYRKQLSIEVGEPIPSYSNSNNNFKSLTSTGYSSSFDGLPPVPSQPNMQSSFDPSQWSSSSHDFTPDKFNSQQVNSQVNIAQVSDSLATAFTQASRWFNDLRDNALRYSRQAAEKIVEVGKVARDEGYQLSSKIVAATGSANNTSNRSSTYGAPITNPFNTSQQYPNNTSQKHTDSCENGGYSRPTSQYRIVEEGIQRFDGFDNLPKEAENPKLRTRDLIKFDDDI